MIEKKNERQQAIVLRRQGKTYKEILQTIKVAKSTLSLWLRSVGLAQTQKQRITEKRIQGQKRGAEARRVKRVNETLDIHARSLKEIDSLSARELFLIGVVMYWCEGTKERQPGRARTDFCNSDPYMIRVFLKWLELLGVNQSQVKFEIYIHEIYKQRSAAITEYWKGVTAYEQSVYVVYYKKHRINSTNRKNVGNLYNGLVRVRVVKSSALIRKIQGWTQAIANTILGISDDPRICP